MASAVKAFIERQGIKLPIKIEPVLISANPGMHIDFLNPAIKVMMIDGIKSFVSGLSAAAPVLRAEAVHEFTERILNPRPPRKDVAPGMPTGMPAGTEEKTQPPQSVSRARAIFDAAEEAKPFNPADFDFAMVDDETALDELTPSGEDANPATPLPGPALALQTDPRHDGTSTGDRCRSGNRPLMHSGRFCLYSSQF